ncbi:hypothetical protein RIR_jg32420.t1 [Rhizophagus irregularis DAOM 181602=DAOM 197198]|nr:hypothetical protein RIR_jg32420.t1 [Rhizophagus irregularis DAOM 181602=DAOM 197198]
MRLLQVLLIMIIAYKVICHRLTYYILSITIGVTERDAFIYSMAFLSDEGKYIKKISFVPFYCKAPIYRHLEFLI